MDEALTIRLRVNGTEVVRNVPVRRTLVDFLREDLALTGSHVGCEHGICGACQVRVDGRTVRGCLFLAVQADGCEVTTIEGLTASGEAAALQDAFVSHAAMQCGFCTPGMLFTALDLLEQPGDLDREAVREGLSGNVCRCTGYQPIVDAILAVKGQAS